ncbi:hypothetical protein F3N42_07240 [Marinihelvus fidelis]|uniref:Uncharacterized protein n=1 Tax=Marinihelvus fidelis TaxID=2613842 RepID=A0A5N0TAJ7_9GAMM|nr:hypothetical protein [Marinihelvus fidelis]KAA9131960.1 hypothetical protein F3N42_07240 [Marinihelvus fidelis]
MNIKELIDVAKKRQNIPSDLQLSKALGVSSQTVYNWRDGVSFPTPSHAYKLAEMAGVDPAGVITDVLAKAEKNPDVKKVFEAIQKCVTAAAAAIVLTALPVSESTASSKSMIYQEYTLCAVDVRRFSTAIGTTRPSGAATPRRPATHR